MLVIPVLLSPCFKDLVAFVAVADREDVEEAVKLEMFEDHVDVDNDNVDETNQPIEETSNVQHQGLEASCSETVSPEKK